MSKSEKNFNIFVEFSDSNLGYSVYNYQAVDIGSLTDYSTYETNGILFYIISTDIGYQAICSHGGYQYIIIYNDYKILIDILSNMKGL
jgi:hypothetical protein